jgi:hypothetical protein
MPIIEYTNDKYFRLMMLSLLIHDFIHDYGALGSLNRIKSLQGLSEEISGGKGNKRRFISKGTVNHGVNAKTTGGTKAEEIARLNALKAEEKLTEYNISTHDIDNEILETTDFFYTDDRSLRDLSEYEYSPDILCFLHENVDGFDEETFSVDITKPITRATILENRDNIDAMLKNEGEINNALKTNVGINSILTSILIVYSVDKNIDMIGLIQSIYQYIEQTVFRVMGIQETDLDWDGIRNRRKPPTHTGKGKPYTGGYGDGPTLVAVSSEPSLLDKPYEPQMRSVFEAPKIQIVQPVIVPNDNIQNVLDAIINDNVENDNLRDIKSTEIYEALNMVGDENDKQSVENLKLVNKTVHQIIKGTYTFFLQREYTNKYAILNSHYLKQILIKYLWVVIHYPKINPKMNKSNFIIKLSNTFVNNVGTMLNKMCPLQIPNKQTGFGKKIKKKMLGGDFDANKLTDIADRGLKTMTVKRNQLIKRLTKLNSTIKPVVRPNHRRYKTISKYNEGIQQQIENEIYKFNQDILLNYPNQSGSGVPSTKDTETKHIVNLLCSEVAFNGLFNMGISDENSEVTYFPNPDNGEKIFNRQIEIIDGISNGIINVSRIDELLLSSIINVPTLWDEDTPPNNNRYKQFTSGRFIQFINSKRGTTNISTINNAIAKKSYREFLDSAVCSTPQYIDAMGSFGSCNVKRIQDTNNEFPSTIDIRIQTDNPDYYTTFIKHDNNRVILEYDFSVDSIEAVPYHANFYLKNGSNLLSASNTMSSLSTKLMKEWQNRKAFDSSQPTEGIFQDLFKDHFNELISIASQKGKGDRGQEENAVFRDAGYRTYTNYDPGSIRIGAMGDRPSGFRAMLDMKFLHNNSVRANTIAGYFGPKNSVGIYSNNLLPQVTQQFGKGKKSKKRRNTKIKKGGSKKYTRRTKKQTRRNNE